MKLNKKMKKIRKLGFFYNTAGSVTNQLGIVNQSELDIINIKVLENLAHRSIGLWASASPSNPKEVANGGTARFSRTKLVKFGDYTAANRNTSGDLPALEAITIPITGQQKASYEIETLDSVGLAEMNREGFLANIANGLSIGLASFMDAIYLAQIKAQAESLASSAGLIAIPNVDDLNTAALREAAYRQIARGRNDITRIVNEYNIGTPRDRYSVILHPNLLADLLLAMPKGGNEATRVGLELTEGFQEVAGLGIIKDHVFLNQALPAGPTGFNKDVAFDFSGVWGAIAYEDAVFVAISGLITRQVIDPDSGNDKFITKFNYFRGQVRKELVRIIVKETPPSSDQPAAEPKPLTTKEIVKKFKKEFDIVK